MRSKPITNKASSACKINMGLVTGQADLANSKAFIDYSKLMEDKMKMGGGKTASKEITVKNKDVDPEKNKDVVPETTVENKGVDPEIKK